MDRLVIWYSRLPVPTLVTYNKTSYQADEEIFHEADIGPEVTHIYQVERHRPSDKLADRPHWGNLVWLVQKMTTMG